MQKIVLVIPYYGKWPAYFREWAYTAGCLQKQNIDFLLISDLSTPFPLPQNIRKIELSFSQLREKIQSCFDFPICLHTPYKLCDFKPAYGEIFHKEIQGYAFWGHCDMDLIWGNVRKFITDEILNHYDRVQYLGHCTFYRNCQDMNTLFRQDGGIYSYRRIQSTPYDYSFDEHSGMMQIVVKHGVSNYVAHNHADISPRYRQLVISRVPNYKQQVLYWHDGAVYRKYIDETGNVGCDEFMYAHFQKKHPASMTTWDAEPAPSAFLYSAEGFQKILPEEINRAFIVQHTALDDAISMKCENFRYIVGKLIHFGKCSLQEKIIWVKQRRAAKELKKYKDYFPE